jgi:hypothetical protein
MTRVLFLGCIACFTSVACAAATPARMPPVAAKSAEKAVSETPGVEPKGADGRAVGDFFVQRFSGAYRSSPVTLSEEVVALEGGLWVVDYTLEEAAGATKMRVRIDPATDGIVRVSAFDGKTERDLPLAAYDRVAQATSFGVDSNEGLIGSERATCLVGPDELDCVTKSYKISFGDKPGKLVISQSDRVPGRDLGGEIVAADGTLMYRAETLEIVHGTPSKSDVASR